MSKENNTDTASETEQAPAPTADAAAMVVGQGGGGSDLTVGQDTLRRAQQAGLSMPQNREQLEIISELMEAEAAIDSIGLPMVNSTDLVGVPVTLLDATFKQLNDPKEGQKTVVQFLLQRQDTGENITCTKSSNAFNDLYVTFFNKWRAVAPRTIENMTFAIDPKFSKANNPAIVLRRIQGQAKQVGG